MRITRLTAIAVLACGFTAEPLDISGWTFTRSLPLGASVHGVGTAHAPLPARSGETSIRFHVRPGDCSAGKHGWDDCKKDRERAELKQTDYQHHGETWWYGFSMFVPLSHRPIWPAKLSFAQFHQEGAKPALMLQNHKGGLWLDIHDARRTVKLLPLIAAQDFAGRWHDISLQVRWSRRSDGFIRAFVDGKPAASFDGPTMSAGKIYFKFGLYRSHLNRNQKSREISHMVYFDNVVRSRQPIIISGH